MSVTTIYSGLDSSYVEVSNPHGDELLLAAVTPGARSHIVFTPRRAADLIEALQKVAAELPPFEKDISRRPGKLRRA